MWFFNISCFEDWNTLHNSFLSENYLKIYCIKSRNELHYTALIHQEIVWNLTMNTVRIWEGFVLGMTENTKSWISCTNLKPKHIITFLCFGPNVSLSILINTIGCTFSGELSTIKHENRCVSAIFIIRDIRAAVLS